MSFFNHNPRDYRGGVCVGVSTGQDILPSRDLQYQSQRATGRLDAMAEFFNWRGLSFVPTPSAESPEKITKPADSSHLQARPTDWLQRVSRCWELQQGVRMSPAPHFHTTGWSHRTSSSQTRPAGAGAHRLTTHTFRSGAFQRLNHTQHCSLALPHIKDENKYFTLDCG